MVTLNQFLMYCIRNSIQTVRLRVCYDTSMNFSYCHTLMYTWMKRGKEQYLEDGDTNVTYYISPYHFYKYCMKNLYDPNAVVEGVMRNHMRRKGKKPATFIGAGAPF